jgi:hypothetical protein
MPQAEQWQQIVATEDTSNGFSLVQLLLAEELLLAVGMTSTMPLLACTVQVQHDVLGKTLQHRAPTCRPIDESSNSGS